MITYKSKFLINKDSIDVEYLLKDYRLFLYSKWLVVYDKMFMVVVWSMYILQMELVLER